MGSSKNLKQDLKQKPDNSKRVRRAKSFREFVDWLNEEGLLRWAWRMNEVPKDQQTPFRVVITESGAPLVSNVFATRNLIAKYLGVDKKDLPAKLLYAIQNPSDPKEVSASEAPVLKVCIFSSENMDPVAPYTFIERTNGTINAAMVLGVPPSVPLASVLVNSLNLPHDPLRIANTLTPLKIVKLSNGIWIPADAEAVFVGTIIKDDEEATVEKANLENNKSAVMKVNILYCRYNPLFHSLSDSELELLSTLVKEVQVMYKHSTKSLRDLAEDIEKGMIY